MAKSNLKVTFLCPIETVWDIVTDLKNYSWRSDLKGIKVVDKNSFIEIVKDGIETNIETIRIEKNNIWEFSLANENLSGTWIGRFYPQGDKTSLDFTEKVVAKNILLKPFIVSYLRKQQRVYFEDLKKALAYQEASKIQML